MLSPNKKLVTVIMEKLKAANGEDESRSRDEMNSDFQDNDGDANVNEEECNVACEMCMEDFLACLENKDAKGMAMALRDFLDVMED